jgi:trimeric autotransporter adhesin
MKKYILLSVFCVAAFSWCKSQNIGIGTPNPDTSAILDITNTEKGLLIPRMATARIAAIASPAKGLLVYDSSLNQLKVNMGTPAAPDWQTIIAKSGWSLTGNAGTSASSFLGTTDGQPLQFWQNNQWAGTIDSNRTNVYIGYNSGVNTKGDGENTATGYGSLGTPSDPYYVTLINCTANGSFTLSQQQSELDNTANGTYALSQSLDGISNTANGEEAMKWSVSANENTANGSGALTNLNSGESNTASGNGALSSNTQGYNNTASGYLALYQTAATYTPAYSNNTGIGAQALFTNNTGVSNTAIGYRTLAQTTKTNSNTAIGYNAGTTYDNDENNVFVGANTDANAANYHNVVAIGQGTVVTGSSMARFGNSATVSYGGWAAWTNVSDGRFKTNIKENVPGLAFINQLRPVTYHLKATALDQFLHSNSKQASQAVYTKALQQKEAIVYTGLVAQEVEAAAKKIGFDFSGVDAPKNGNDTYGLRYDEFVVPLIKAVQELTKENDELQTQIDGLKALIKK